LNWLVLAVKPIIGNPVCRPRKR